MNTLIYGIILAFIATIFGSLGSLFVKKGSKDISRKISSLIQNRNLILGIVLFVLSILVYIAGLRFGDLSVLFPITSLTYVWIAFLSIKYLNESMNKYKWLGILFIVVGVLLIAR